jgi:biotin carboxylase
MYDLGGCICIEAASNNLAYLKMSNICAAAEITNAVYNTSGCGFFLIQEFSKYVRNTELNLVRLLRK